MRIVQLANFHTPTSGGLRTVLDRLGRRYAQAGNEVWRIVPGTTDSIDLLGDVTEVRLRSPRVPGMGGYRAIVDRKRVADLLARLEPDVIELSDKTTLVNVASQQRARGAAVVLISHERIDAILARRVPRQVPLTPIADRWNRHLVESVDAVVCCSQFAAAEFIRIDAPVVRRIPLGVDLETFRPSARPPARVDGPLRLITVGRLSAEKRPDLAIDVLRKLTDRGFDAELTIVGDGPMRASLERRGSSLAVHYVGHVGSRSTLVELLNNADICIAPCDAETFGLAALEALACGTPIVVPATGALAELIAGTPAGRVVATNVATDEAAGFADEAARLAAADTNAIRRSARQRAERFDWAATANSMLTLMNTLRHPDRAEEPTDDATNRYLATH